MGLFTRPGRAVGLTTGGAHFCTACQGSGACTTRTWTSRGWERSYGRCGACHGKGSKFQNHAPRGRVTRGGLGASDLRTPKKG